MLCGVFSKIHPAEGSRPGTIVIRRKSPQPRIGPVVYDARNLPEEVGNTHDVIMTTLTIMASIFIPLTFMAGIHGMNFDTMPEARTPWMDPRTLGTIVGIAGGMRDYIRRKGWLGGRPQP